MHRSVLHGDCPARARSLAGGDVLLECRGAFNRWLVGLLMLPDLIGAAVARDSAFLRAHFLVPNWFLHNIVFDKRVLEPAVNGKKGNARARERATIGDRAGRVIESVFERDD
jgi:hypothetical protein